MVESTGSSDAHQELLTLKENILAQWSRLPPEHQVTMLLVLIERMKSSAYGTWAAQAIELLSNPQEPSAAASAIPHLTPQDLARHTDLAPDEIAHLSAGDLREISATVLRHLVYDVFWNEVEYVARQQLYDAR